MTEIYWLLCTTFPLSEYAQIQNLPPSYTAKSVPVVWHLENRQNLQECDSVQVHNYVTGTNSKTAITYRSMLTQQMLIYGTANYRFVKPSVETYCIDCVIGVTISPACMWIAALYPQLRIWVEFRSAALLLSDVGTYALYAQR